MVDRDLVPAPGAGMRLAVEDAVHDVLASALVDPLGLHRRVDRGQNADMPSAGSSAITLATDAVGTMESQYEITALRGFLTRLSERDE
jgi:hypothetical protein